MRVNDDTLFVKNRDVVKLLDSDVARRTVTSSLLVETRKPRIGTRKAAER